MNETDGIHNCFGGQKKKNTSRDQEKDPLKDRVMTTYHGEKISNVRGETSEIALSSHT